MRISNLNKLYGGIDKQWIYSSKFDYSLVCDYLQKINYSIQDLNYEYENIKEAKAKEIIYIIVLSDWIKKSIREIKLSALKKCNFDYQSPNCEELENIRGYIESLRSYVVAHPLNTNKHSKYGLNGDFICVDIRMYNNKPKWVLAYRNEDSFHIGLNGIEPLKVEGDNVCYLFSYSNSKDEYKYVHWVSFDIEDIYNSVNKLINELYCLNSYLRKKKKRDYV